MYYRHGPTTALEFLTADITERSFCFDCLLVFLMVLRCFHVRTESQQQVRLLGIQGALVMRAVLAISRNPFIVHTFNEFAIAGLRALDFAPAWIMGLFRSSTSACPSSCCSSVPR